MIITNPILPGFYPDPSICRVGEYFYLVNSSFAYFPGVPIFKSRDLKNWEQIGNVLDRVSQVPLKEATQSAGIFAPTIRYNNETFYMITTNVSFRGNFIVTAKTPEGPWSEPYFITGADGIDPSIFFDEDGKCYYIGTRPNPTGVKYNGDWCIYIQELDIENMCLLGEYKIVWKGAMLDVEWPEGPHLYKKDGYYYILYAEGGTGDNHAICVARSKNIDGPYEGNKKNPIMTHRHLGKNYPVCYVGHADLVDTVDGKWFAVMLASRPYEKCTNLGRETFLAEVSWEDDWPVINPGVGRLVEAFSTDLVEYSSEYKLINQGYEGVFTFNKGQLDHHFVMLRNPTKKFYSFNEHIGYLRLYLQETSLCEKASPSYIGLRQQHYFYKAEVKFNFSPIQDGEVAGIALLQSEEAHLIFVYGMNACKKGIFVYEKIKREKSKEIRFIPLDIQDKELSLRIIQKGQSISLFYQIQSQEVIQVVDRIDGKNFSTERAGGFVGNTIGMYASSNGKETNAYVDYSSFSYQSL